MTALPPGCRPVDDWERPGEIIPGYAVRDDGMMFWWYPRGQRWMPSKAKIGPYGFHKVRLVIRGKTREIGIAHVVLRAFDGPRPLGCEPLHFPDPDPGNNAATNLRWAPRGTSKVGKMCSGSPPVPRRGSEHFLAVLTEDDIPVIRAMYRAGFRYKEIASDETIRKVLVGETWAHVPDPLGPIAMRAGPESDAAGMTKLDWETVDQIRTERAAGKSYAQIAAGKGVSKCTVRDIVKGRTWRADRA